MVTFYPPDGSKVIPSLVMSPVAEKLVSYTFNTCSSSVADVFRILSNPKVPVWGDGYGYGSCLMDYVPAVGKHLDEMVLMMASTRLYVMWIIWFYSFLIWRRITKRDRNILLHF